MIYPGDRFAYIGSMESALGFFEMKALLEWQLEMGVSEAICNAPIDRYALAKKAPKTGLTKGEAHVEIKAPKIDRTAAAQTAADTAQTLTELQAAMAAFDLCDLKKGARNLVFSDGTIGADIMIITEPPNRDEDRQGKPFVGREGQLLDKMLAAIGLARVDDDKAKTVYITATSPWRPQQNGDLTPEDLAMLVPFLKRHIALATPKILVLMGNAPCQALLNQRAITRIRGKWTEALNIPVMPMVHPGYLLRNPAAKRDAWADLLEIKATLPTTP